MGKYNISQQKIISDFRTLHKVPVIINDEAVVEMIKEEMIKTGKLYPEFASLLDNKSNKKNNNKFNLFELSNNNTDFISDRLELTSKKPKQEAPKTYSPQEKTVAREYIAAMLKNQIENAIFGERGFNVIANPNFISGSEAWQELESVGAYLVHNLNLGHLGIKEPLNRADLEKSLNYTYKSIEELETLVNNPKAFDKKYKEIMNGKSLDYSAVIDFLHAINEHQSAHMQNKLDTLEKIKKPAMRFEKTLEVPAIKDFNKWAGIQETGGSLTGLAIDLALAYLSGGMSAASSAAMKTGQGVTKAVTAQAMKAGMKKEAAEITGQAAGITASQVTGAGLNSAMFQATRTAGALEDGQLTIQELDEIGQSYVGLFKFGYVGSAISGPMGAKFGEWAGKLINNDKAISAILNSSLRQPTTLGNVLTSLSKHSGIVQKAAEFSTSLAINTEYLAQDEGISFNDALTNLLQMEGVSKVVMAFLGGKTTKFLTPEKVQKITTEIENCKVEIAVYKGQKAIKVTTPDGKENFFATHEELIAFVADRVYTEARAGVNKKEVNNEEPLTPNHFLTKGEGKHLAQTDKPATTPARHEGNAESSSSPAAEIKNTLKPYEDLTVLRTVEGRIDYAKVQGLKEVGVAPADAEVMYKKRGFTDSDIEEVRKANPDADKWMQTFEIFSEIKESDSNLDNMSVAKIKEEIIDMADERQANQRLFALINEENLKWAQENLHSTDRQSAIRDLFQFLSNLEDASEVFPEQYRIARMAQELTGAPFNKMMLEAGHIWDEEQLACFTPERIKAGKAITDVLVREFDLFDSKYVENPEQITPEFLAEYKSAKEELEGLNIAFDSHTRNPVNYLQDVRQAIELVKKEGLDFSWYQGKNGSELVPVNNLYLDQILDNPQKLHSIKVFIDMCSPEAAAKYSEDIVTVAFKEGADNPQGVAKIFNQYAKSVYQGSKFNPRNFINTISDYGRRENVNWQGVANLLEVYVKDDFLFNPESDMIVANGDYSGAVKLLNELKPFFDGQEANRIGSENGGAVENRYLSFLANCWEKMIKNENIDFNKAVERVHQLEEKNLQNDIPDYEMFERILTSDDNGIVDKFEIVSKKGLKAEYDRTKDYISNSDVTADDFAKNLDLAEKLAKEIDVMDFQVADAETRLRIANSTLTNKQLVDLFTKAGDKLSAKDKLWLMQAFSKSNREHGQYATIHAQALEVIEKMLKEDFNAEDISSIMWSLNSMSFSGMGYSLVDKLVFNETTRFPRGIASKILNATETPEQANFTEILCFDKELNFPREHIAEIIKNVRKDNFELAEKLCRDKNFPRVLIADIVQHTTKSKVEFAERLCADKDIPKELIAGVLARIKNNQYDGCNIELAGKLCFDKELNFPKDKIAEILYYTNDANINLATRLCTDRELNFPPEDIKGILKQIQSSYVRSGVDKKIELAEKLCTDKELNYPTDKIACLLYSIRNQQNAEFIEKMIYTKDFSTKNIEKLSDYGAVEAKVDEMDQALNTPEIRKWANKNLDNLDVETVINLARTQKKLFAEAKQADETAEIQARKEAARQIQLEHQAAEVKADPVALDKISSALIELGVPEGMAKNAYAKLCVDSNGNIDYTKLEAAKSLIKAYGFYTRVNKKGQTAINPNLTPKDLTDIYKLATGDKMSSQNGEFRPQIIQDIIALKECGIDDIKFAMNLASVKNMSLIEMKARFKGETREDIARRIDEVIEEPLTPNPSPTRGEGNIATALKSRGIDLDAIKEKALTSDKKITDMTIKEGQGQTGNIRSLDKIVGTERVVLNKFKAEVDQSIWQDEAAFKRWAEEKLADITDWEKHPEYLAKGRFDAYNQPRRDSFEKWVEYLNSEECNVHDDVFAKILFLDGLTSEMKPDNAYTPPEISHGAFEAVYNQLLEGNTTVSLTKAYASFNRTKAIQKYGKETTSEDGVNGIWVRIPSGGQRGEPLYDEHIAMIQALSEGSSWCLRFENAHTYLGYGDIHFFVTKQADGSFVSQTAINVLPNGTIREIEKRYNQDCTVPVPYVQVIKEWKEANNFTGMDLQMEQALKAKPEFDRQKAEFAELQQNGDVKGIFSALGREIGDYENGGYYIKSGEGLNGFAYNAFVFGKPYTLFDLGVDENLLMKDVVQVFGSMNLQGSALTSAPKLKLVTGRINFGDNKISDLKSLEELDGRTVYWEK